jgi:putative heme iron utilization protein
MTDAHDAGAPPVAGDPANFPSHAELVRTLLAATGFGSLTTLTDLGYPYGSLAAFSVLPDGAALMCLSDMAEHTQNARRVSRAGLFVAATRSVDDSHDPLDEPRASIIGDLHTFDPSPADIERHLARHSQTANYMDFSDFGWWRLTIVAARFVGGFGSMSWVAGADIVDATADPVMPDARAAIDHMNADHADACLDMARGLAGLDGATAATVHAIDRHGLTLYVDTTDGFRVARLGFPDGPLGEASQVRGAVVELTRRARTAGAP